MSMASSSPDSKLYEAKCLCGSVSWALSADPYAIYNCHCRMCQKVHGTAFGTYCFVRNDQFHWTDSTDTIIRYRSSEALVRSSCDTCGSVVPYQGDGEEFWIAPGGCHDEMRKPDYNIFVVDNSPWHTISGNLPECDTYPEDAGIPSVEGLPVPGHADGPIHGSCLCGDVRYEVTEPLSVIHYCHCTRCRYGRAAAHASNGFVSYDGLQYLSGEEQLKHFKVPDARYFTQVFCRKCSSLMPRKDPERGICVIPLGSLDDDPVSRPVDHIFVDHKAQWHDITDGLPQFAEGPPPS